MKEDIKNPFASGAFLGYMAQCENEELLDRVVAAFKADETLDLYEACYQAGVDVLSLSDSDIDYIIKECDR